MRNLLFIAMFAISFCAMPPIAPANTKNISSNYSTMWLMQWLHECSTALSPSYAMRGLPQQYAMQKAVQDCACVIDKFRENFSQSEADGMAVEDRQLFSEQYTIECLGAFKGT